MSGYKSELEYIQVQAASCGAYQNVDEHKTYSILSRPFFVLSSSSFVQKTSGQSNISGQNLPKLVSVVEGRHKIVLANVARISEEEKSTATDFIARDLLHLKLTFYSNL